MLRSNRANDDSELAERHLVTLDRLVSMQPDLPEEHRVQISYERMQDTLQPQEPVSDKERVSWAKQRVQALHSANRLSNAQYHSSRFAME